MANPDRRRTVRWWTLRSN